MCGANDLFLLAKKENDIRSSVFGGGVEEREGLRVFAAWCFGWFWKKHIFRALFGVRWKAREKNNEKQVLKMIEIFFCLPGEDTEGYGSSAREREKNGSKSQGSFYLVPAVFFSSCTAFGEQ